MTKKSTVLSNIKKSTTTKQEIEKAMEVFEKSDSKYGKGKKKQIVSVKTKTGKTAYQMRTVGSKETTKILDDAASGKISGKDFNKKIPKGEVSKPAKDHSSFANKEDKKPLSAEQKQALIESAKIKAQANKPKDLSTLSVKELYDEQSKLHISTASLKNTLLIGDKDSPAYKEAKNKYENIWEEIFRINSLIRKKMESNDSKTQTEEVVQVPVSKSPTEANGEKITMKVVKKEGGKYAKSGKRQLEHNGIKQGDKVFFDLGGKRVKGEFRHMNINIHSPKGYYVIIAEVNGKKKLFERKPETVSKNK